MMPKGNRIATNLEMRIFHSDLAVAAQQRFGQICPCCRHPMVKPRKRNEANRRRRDKITVAHDRGVGDGGNPERWVYACQGCNTDQGARPFKMWAEALRYAGDRRAVFVAELAEFIYQYYGERNVLPAPSGPPTTERDGTANYRCEAF